MHDGGCDQGIGLLQRVEPGRPDGLPHGPDCRQGREHLPEPLPPPEEGVYIFDSSDFRRLRLHEAIFKGFDGERVIRPGQDLPQALLEGEGGVAL